MFIDVNKVATVFGRSDIDEYINKELKNGNLVRIKKKAQTPVNGTALIAGGYREGALTNGTIADSKTSVKEKNETTSVTDENGTSYSLVTDDNTLNKLNSEKTVKVYRAMQVIDGKLYPPMAASVGKKLVDPIQLGKWEQADEHPELIKVEMLPAHAGGDPAPFPAFLPLASC